MGSDDGRQIDAVLALNQLRNAVAALKDAPFHRKADIAEAALDAALDVFTAQQGEIERLKQWRGTR